MDKWIERFFIYFRDTGSQEAKNKLFNRIWRDYYARLRFFSARILKNEESGISDAVQEILLKVFRNLEKYNPLHSFSTWIFTIARNTCLDLRKKNGLPALPLEEEMIHSKNGSPEEILLGKCTTLSIEEFMQNLPGIESQIAYLRFYEKLRIREISHVLHIPEGTVKYKIHTIKEDLKAFLKE